MLEAAWILFAVGIHLKADMSETASSDNLGTKVEVRNLPHLSLVIVFGIFCHNASPDGGAG
jgi:hypothetical protein